MIIAIDGPAGSGKSTVAKLVASRLGFTYLDTGAMYRAVAWRAVEEGIDLTDPLSEASVNALEKIATEEPISFGYRSGEALPSQIFISGRDVSKQIRTPEADLAVSPVSATPQVRTALTRQQQVIGSANNTVMEGRDIGTVVFPQAELKIFMTASVEERAQRRTIQNVSRNGLTYDDLQFQKILADIKRRDDYDSSRQTAPLKPASDSIELDTTGLTIDKVVQKIVDMAKDLQG